MAGGLAIANELTTKTEFLTLTFGLTDGWWLFEDAERRIPGAPLLSRCAALWPIVRGAVPACAALQWWGFVQVCISRTRPNQCSASGPVPCSVGSELLSLVMIPDVNGRYAV